MADIYDLATYEPRNGISFLLQRVRAEWVLALDREFAADGQLAAMHVTSAQFSILAALSLGLAKSASDLCKDISYDAGAMTRMIDRLEEKGFLRRRRDPSDGRLVNLELTVKGDIAQLRMRELSLSVLNRLLRGFTKTEAGQLEAFLRRMLANAGSTAS